MTDSANREGLKHLCARRVRQFPKLFRGDAKANLQRASRYWKSRDVILSRYRNKSKKNGTFISRCIRFGVKTYTMKSSTGRGRKRSPWATALYKALLEDFDRMRNAGVRFTVSFLQRLAQRIIREGNIAVYGPEVRDSRSGKLLSSHISTRWVQNFIQNHNIVCRSQCGKLMTSPAKRELIEREVAYHLGQVSRELKGGRLKKRTS